jgi:hypothetical protein
MEKQTSSDRSQRESDGPVKEMQRDLFGKTLSAGKADLND